ncbi:SycD/LcrH family type III secretion system chaperone [Endozoicomonas arenosclerae]|uniref:SycD/LcrH family type III secretion system chaperone n=1 Tax=Endozoicomonas arenosclerae TaxID=1633495 RepID=UPI00078153D0|nr:SycD/LcrH family type III secretion system chaperone [Endozoicomonas arenosclerae]
MSSLQPDAEAGKDLWLAYLNKGGTIRELRGLDQDQMEAIYQLGFSHYSIGHYSDALKVFRYLALLDHHNPRYYLGIALALHHLNHDAAAIPALNYAEKLNKNDPRPAICMTECFIRLKNRKLAVKALGNAAKILKSSKGWEEEKKQARQLKHYLIDSTGRK